MEVPFEEVFTTIRKGEEVYMEAFLGLGHKVTIEKGLSNWLIFEKSGKPVTIREGMRFCTKEK